MSEFLAALPALLRARLPSRRARSGPAPPRPVDLERREPVHGLGRRRPDPGRARPRPGPAASSWRPSDGPRPADPAHLGADPGHPHGRARPGGGRAQLAPGPPGLAPQRAPLRGPAGQEQGARSSSEFGEEQLMLWRRSYDTPPPPLAADNPYDVAGDPRYRDLDPARRPAHRVPGRRGAPGRPLLGVGHRARPARHAPRRAAPCWWPPTATPSGPCASTSRASPTTTSPGSRSRPASPTACCSTTTSSRALGRLPG